MLRRCDMKITPIKNYKRPEYALKIAALMTAAVSLSGCTERGTVTESSVPVTEQNGAGSQITSPASQSKVSYATPTVAPETTNFSGTVTTVSESAAVTTTPAEISDSGISGAKVMYSSEKSAALSAAGIITSAAVTTAVTSTTTSVPETEIVELDGDVEIPVELEGEPAIDEDDLNPVGIVPCGTDDYCEPVELAGDVAFIPDHNDPQIFSGEYLDYFAEVCCSHFYTAFGKLGFESEVEIYEGSPDNRITFRSDNIEISQFVRSVIYLTKDGETKRINIVFINADSEEAQTLAETEDITVLDGGYYTDNASDSGGNDANALFLAVPDFNYPLSEEFGNALAEDLAEKGII